MKTDVLLRELNEKVRVNIGDEDKPEINDYIKEKWQNIISLVAELLEVPAGLIMQITKEHMNVFLKSENEDNPYPSDGKDLLLHGLYCETVIGTDKELVVENSLENEKWKDNPDVNLDMISYYGLPIKWEDGSFFGTICALDNKTNQFSEKYRQLMMFFKNIIEQDLMMLEQNQRLQIISDYDALTKAYNRRKFDQVLEEYFEDYTRYKHPFALVMLDIDSFKYINDTYGHVEGDKV
ncbi:MAG: GGDEF domain-containing protein [Candidatus Izemoplasmataceae bacterium]